MRVLLMRSSVRRHLRVPAAAWMFVTAGWTGATLLAQTPEKTVPVAAMARDAHPDWEVATVRPSDPAETRGQDFVLKGHRVALMNMSVRQLVAFGYSVQKVQIAGLPDWALTARWNVDGSPDVDGQPSLQQLQEMARKILAERFGVQMHHEQRPMAVLALTTAKHGPRFRANTGDPNGWLQQRHSDTDGRHVEKLRNVSMPELALILQYYVSLPVMDQTGLKGRYDLDLQWMVGEPQSPQPVVLPDLFGAVQEQIGLKLDQVKAPADVLVIDRVEKPGAN